MVAYVQECETVGWVDVRHWVWGGMAFVGRIDMVIPKILDWVLFASAGLLECMGDWSN